MSNQPTPDRLFDALVKSVGGKVISSHSYHHITGPRIPIPANELPTKWEMEVKDDVVIVHIEGSQEALDRIQWAAEQVGVELEDDE